MSSLVPRPERSRNKSAPKYGDKVRIGPDAADYAKEASTDPKARYRQLEETRNWFTWTALPIFLVGVGFVYWLLIFPGLLFAIGLLLGPDAPISNRVTGLEILFIVMLWLFIPVVLLSMYFVNAGVAISGNNKFRMVGIGMGLVIGVSFIREGHFSILNLLGTGLDILILVVLVLVIRSVLRRRKDKAKLSSRPKKPQ